MTTYQITRLTGEKEAFKIGIADADVEAWLELSADQLDSFINLLATVAEGMADSIAVQL